MTVDGGEEPHASAILASIFELLASAILAYIGRFERVGSVVLCLHPIASLWWSAGESVGSAVVVSPLHSHP